MRLTISEDCSIQAGHHYAIVDASLLNREEAAQLGFLLMFWSDWGELPKAPDLVRVTEPFVL